MKYVTWLREHGIWTAVYLFALVTIELFLVTMSGGGFLMGYVFVALTGCFFGGTYIEFQRMKSYFVELSSAMEILKEKYLFYEMIERQDSQEEKEVKELFYQVETSTLSELEFLKKNSEDYRDFVETWVHEIKIPIAVIRMILANHKEADVGLSGEVERMERYVEQALFYARSSVVSKDYLVGPLDLKKTVEQTVLARRRQLREINARIDLHDLELEVYSDGKWVQFMLGQVMDNSMKYASKKDADGCGLVLEIYATNTANAIQLHMKDNGIGIKASELDRVFDKGFTGQNGRSGAKSTGIGLYLCKKLCDKLGHGISLTSTEGEGTEVTFVFPKSSMTKVME
ncbi:MAG: sensor histidine kinase [Lachnospiraceae bacterium]|nr:sensor histidine kinase [Lachnospiraceae bacterium]MBR6150574.1 sensor histidine kinase [Lachnospiraceae bacterium]